MTRIQLKPFALYAAICKSTVQFFLQFFHVRGFDQSDNPTSAWQDGGYLLHAIAGIYGSTNLDQATNIFAQKVNVTALGPSSPPKPRNKALGLSSSHLDRAQLFTLRKACDDGVVRTTKRLGSHIDHASIALKRRCYLGIRVAGHFSPRFL